MSQFNTTSLDSALETKINALTTSSSTDELIQIAHAVGNSDKKLSVISILDLPTTAEIGTTIYVDELGVPVIYGQSGWYTLDGTWVSGSKFLIQSTGANAYGQLGAGHTASMSSPVSLITPANSWTWKKVLSGGNTAAYIKYDNTIWICGSNNYGLAGDNSSGNKTSPVSLVSPANSWAWKQIEMGLNHAIGIRFDGIIWGWGKNSNGQLGDNTNLNKSSPVSLIAPANSWTWKQVTCNGDSSHAIRSDNTFWSWGGNLYGQSGNNFIVAVNSSPVSLVAPANSWTWKQVSAGRNQTIAIKSDDTLWSWGGNSYGELGIGTATNTSSPVSLIAPANSWTWKQVSGGTYFSAAIKSDDTVWVWGKNNLNQLGDGTTINKSSPVSVLGGFTWKEISCGYALTLGIKSDNTGWYWGYNPKGNGGDNTVITRSSPSPFVNSLKLWKSLSSLKQQSTSIGIEINSI